MADIIFVITLLLFMGFVLSMAWMMFLGFRGQGIQETRSEKLDRYCMFLVKAAMSILRVIETLAKLAVLVVVILLVINLGPIWMLVFVSTYCAYQLSIISRSLMQSRKDCDGL